MWHEARKQEKKLRGLMVDYKKRAERRRNYYERIVSNATNVMCVLNAYIRVYVNIHYRRYISLGVIIIYIVSPPSALL